MVTIRLESTASLFKRCPECLQRKDRFVNVTIAERQFILCISCADSFWHKLGATLHPLLGVSRDKL